MKTLLFVIITFFLAFDETFYDQQRESNRFVKAEKEKKEFVTALFKSKGLSFPDIEILIRVFKNEESLELWARKPQTNKFSLIRAYHICSNSGNLGPKRKIGDGQVPEGCYYIDKFNPYSNFYLSLGINYPNSGDKIANGKGNYGGDIFIHGDCVTIGCVPITDNFIKELYYICVCAKNNGQDKIPVYIFPLRMDDKGMELLKSNFTDNTLKLFWDSLRFVYTKFEESNDIVEYTFDKKGNYITK